jgi:EmrB/QacA subfamily drug resistance transporter
MLEAATPRRVLPPCRQEAEGSRFALIVAIAGSTMAFIDGTVVNVALPVMQKETGATVDQMQWVVEAYALMLASLVLVGGALGDRLGRRRVFVVGVVSFALASAVCGLSPSPTFLIGARAAQGVGAALLVPGSLSLIGAAFPEETRGRAIGTWSATTSVAAAIGPVLGGWVVEHLSWRWIFFFNVPVGAAVAVLATQRVADTRDDEARGKLDVVGALLAIVGLGAIVWALLEAPSMGGLGTPSALALLVGGIAVLGVFVFVEHRTPAPMVPLSLFRSRTFAGTNLATLLLYAALGACFFFVPFDLIQVQGYAPPAAGAALLPFVVLVSSLSPWAGGLVPRYGPRLPLVVGPLFSGAGFALLAFPSVGGSYISSFFPGIVVLGLGMGLTVAPLTTAVMASVEARHAGVASGINNAVARAAGLLSVAALGVILRARFDAELDRELARLSLPNDLRSLIESQRGRLAGVELGSDLDAGTRDALRHALDASFVSGFRTLMVVCAALAALAAMAALVLVEGRRADARRWSLPQPSDRT